MELSKIHAGTHLVAHEVPVQRVTSDVFVPGKVNCTQVIRDLKEINGVPVEELERRMRPEAWSEVGFLGNDESLVYLLAKDNETVLRHGVTHSQIGEALQKAIYRKDLNNGYSYGVKWTQYRGFQECPFGDDKRGSSDGYICKKHWPWREDRIYVSQLHPWMIKQYGFYEGEGSPWRVSPEKLIEFFELKPEKKR